MHILKSAIVYFLIIFVAGFLFGTIRVPFLVPKLGERVAELIESPFMFAAILVTARQIDKSFMGSRCQLLAVGVMASIFLLLTEILAGYVLMGHSIRDTLLNHDPISGAVYYSLIVISAVLPALLRK